MAKHKLYASPVSSPSLNSGGSIEMNSDSVTATPKLGGLKLNLKKTDAHNKSKMKKSETNSNAVPKTKPVKKMDSTIKNPENSTKVDSDSDSMNETDFFSKSQMKMPYTIQEDEFILKYVLKGDNIFKTSSLSLWKQLEYKKENPKRTYQSLKNRFLRNIKPVIFSTHRSLIKDKETAQKILRKYPELKDKYQAQKTIPVVKVPLRPLKSSEDTNKETISSIVEENSVSSTSPLDTSKPGRSEEKVSELVFLPVQIPYTVRNIFGKRNYRDNIECEKEKIRVRLNFNKRDSTKAEESPCMGVYQRFSELKKKNFKVRCEACGRCDQNQPAFEESESDSDSDREGNLVIADSVGTPEKEITEKEVYTEDSNSSVLQPPTKKRKNIFDSDDCSPSLMNDMGEPERQKKKEVEKSKGNSQPKNLNDFLSDKDLDSLYQETVAHCRMFMDSDKEEEDLNTSLKNSKNSTLGFPPKISTDKTSVEDFFINSEPSSSEAAASNLVDKIISSKEKTPLAKNMARMLKRGKKT